MKTVNEKTDAVKQEERRRKGRISYYTNKLGMSQSEAEKRADGKKPSALDIVHNTAPGELSPWKQRQLAKKKGQPQPLKLNMCPQCKTAFLIRKDGEREEIVGLDTCPVCGVRFYFCE